MIGRAHIALAAALAACLAAIGGFAYGVNVGETRQRADQARVDAASAAQRAALQRQIDAASQRAQAAEIHRQTSAREIRHESEKIIERPVYGAVCVDADGVGLLDRAAATANGDSVAAPSGAARSLAGSPTD